MSRQGVNAGFVGDGARSSLSTPRLPAGPGPISLPGQAARPCRPVAARDGRPAPAPLSKLINAPILAISRVFSRKTNACLLD